MKKLRKILKKVLLSLLAVLLAAVLCLIVALGWFYPRYVSNKKTVPVPGPDGKEICVMSCNLRCMTPLDFGRKTWFYRANLIMEDIAQQDPCIIGFQEATKWQYRYLVDVLTGYDSVITYRDTSPLSEGCPIFYNTALYTLVDKGSFWLSETPDEMSKDWDSACYRICSYVILTENSSGRDFVVFNTHLDHVSDLARINGINVVLDKIARFGSLPSVIMGDFNALEGSETYQSVTSSFDDALYEAETAAGTSYTYQNWGNLENAKRLDYFMLSPDDFLVREYQVIPAVHNGTYSSDHCPIVMSAVLADE